MSRNIKVQTSKSNPNSKLENLLESYNSLKLILTPNLTEKNIVFMNSLIDLIISQVKIYISLLNLNEVKKIYDILNINNQNLSKQIANLYEITNNKYSSTSLLEKEKTENNTQTNIYKKDFDLLEDQKELFNIKDSRNIDSTDNHKEKETKYIENEKFKELKVNKNEKVKEKKIKDKNIDKDKERMIKFKEELDKIKEKERLIQNLKEQEKEKEKEIREKAKKIIQKRKLKEKENIKTQFRNYSNLTKLEQKTRTKTIKFESLSSPKIEIEPKTPYNIHHIEVDKEKLNEIKNKKISYTPLKQKDKHRYILFDDIDAENNNENENKFKRKGKRSKTVLYESFQIPYIFDIEKNGNILPMNISVTFTNRLLDKNKKAKKERNKNIKMKLEENNINNKINNNVRKSNRYIDNYGAKTEYKSNSNKKFKSKAFKLNLPKETFSLDDFLIPYNNPNSKKGEELFLTKTGKVLINRKQKDILEDYINNYLSEEDSNLNRSEKKIKLNHKLDLVPISQELKEKLKSNQKNKKFKIKNSSTNYDLNDVNEVFKKLPSYFQIPIDDFYLRKKKASLFDRSIFKICHKVIDSYKELEDKEDIFTFKRSKSRPKSLYNGFDNKHNAIYKRIYSN